MDNDKKLYDFFMRAAKNAVFIENNRRHEFVITDSKRNIDNFSKPLLNIENVSKKENIDA